MSQLTFSPHVLARVAPDISLDRHIAEGVRPCLRGFDEFKPVKTSSGPLNTSEGIPVVGSSIVKSGSTTVFCGISVGTVEQDTTNASKYASVYPVVEVSRGRSGAPTDEEMILSEALYESVLHSRIIPRGALRVTPGVAVINDGGTEHQSVSIYYPDIHPDEYEILDKQRMSNHEMVLTAHLKVLSRDGPLFDICHKALVEALLDVRLPRMYINETVDIRVPVRSRGNFGHLNSQKQLNIDGNTDISKPIQLETANIGLSSSFGVVNSAEKPVLLAQLEGDAEETAATSRMNIVATKDGLQGFSLSGNIDRNMIKKAIELSQLRAELAP
ncbi:Exosome complex component RRP43 [Meyerozyma sp. JA9]|nr:Exosome complex component RRP43 [Meyerozyma sp. JA9]